MAETATDPHLIWIDLEMTGLEPERDHIIEIATIITDGNLKVVAEGPDLVIHQPQALLDMMDDWNVKHHTASGLVEKIQQSKLTVQEAEQQTVAFLQQHVPAEKCPIAGNTIGQDKRFLQRYMPTLHAYFHYRSVDVSSIKELAQRWQPELLKKFKKENKHRALEDIKESIAELQYYRDVFFKT